MKNIFRATSLYLGIFVLAMAAQLWFAKPARAVVPQVYFALATSTLQENSSSDPLYSAYYAAVKLSSASATTVQVRFTHSGTASFGPNSLTNDYPNFTTDVVSFVPGQTTAYIKLDPWDNSVLELNKTVNLTLYSPIGATLGAQTSHTHTLVDNDVKFQFVTDAASGSESVSGYTRVVLANGGVAPADISVVATVSSVAGAPGVATQSSDFSLSLPGVFYPVYVPAVPIAPTKVTAVIPAGATSTLIYLGVVNDSEVESDEYFQLTLSNPSAGLIGYPSTFTYTITDNDTVAPPPPAVPTAQFALLASSGSESVSAPSLVVTLSAISASAVSVQYKTGAGATASLGSDFDFSPGTLTIPAGSLSASVPLTILDDSAVEANETVVIILGNPVNATLGANTQHTYTITDNDIAPPPADPGAPPTPPSPPGGGGGTPSTPSSVCPTLNVGDMVKVSGKPAIYAVNKYLKIMYFPSGDEFKSWNQTESYGGYITINQECFDSLPTPAAYPGGINFRPGSYVIKKGAASQLYVVLPNNAVAKISSADAAALYGAGYKVMSVSTVFWPNYVTVALDISGQAHAGMLVRKDGKVWYVDGFTLREVTAAGMTANRFKDAFARVVPSSYLFGLGLSPAIDAEVLEVNNRTQL